MKKNAPIALFVYNRPEHTIGNLKKLNEALDAEQTTLYIFSDAAQNEKEAENVKEVRKIVQNFSKTSNFKEVKIIYANKNKGLAQSIIDGVSSLIKEYHQVIVLEDDLIVSKDFIRYMNDGLNYYADDQSIWAISGYSFPMKALNHYPYDVYLACRGCSWGWATWENRWNTVDWDVQDYDSFKFNYKKRHLFGLWGRDMPYMLDANAYKMNHSWAIRWCYAAFKQQKYTVYPTVSRIMSNGTDGSGTNYNKTSHKYDTVLYNGTDPCRMEKVEVSEEIRKEFQNHHMSRIKAFYALIRWEIKKRKY